MLACEEGVKRGESLSVSPVPILNLPPTSTELSHRGSHNGAEAGKHTGHAVEVVHTTRVLKTAPLAEQWLYVCTCTCVYMHVCKLHGVQHASTCTCRLLIASSQDSPSTCALLLRVKTFEPSGNIYKRRYVNTAHVARGFKGHHSH